MDTTTPYAEKGHCKSCHWWKEQPEMVRNGLPVGSCHAKSPTTFQRNDERAQLITRWPMTVSLDFCGVHRPANLQPKPAVETAGGAV